MSDNTSTSTITGTVTIGVTLGVGGYASELTLTSTGEIYPIVNGIDGVYAKTGTIVNYGSITGRAGDKGGTGVDIQNGSLSNSGTIVGGVSSYDGTLGLGGAGLELNNATANNSGLIVGGVGGSATISYGGDTSGVGLSQLSGAMINNGTIVGGARHPFVTVTINGSPSYIISTAGTGAKVTGGILLNEGLILGGSGGGSGAEVGGGILMNDGAVIGGVGAEGIKLSAGTLINNGRITGGQYPSGAYKANGYDGAYQSGGALINYGLISGSDGSDFVEGQTETEAGYGVAIAGGTILNLGTISAGSGGVNNGPDNLLGDVGVVIDSGTLFTGGLISGGIDGFGVQGDAVALRSSSAVIITEPGATFIGDVVGSGRNLIELAAGTTKAAGNLEMSGSFSGFSNITFDAGSSWFLGGTPTELAGGEVIQGFATGDTLNLESFGASSQTFVAGSGLVVSNGKSSETLDIIGSFSTSSFFVTDTSDSTQITLETPICYLRGTRIATPVGEVAVECLQIGDAVITRFAGYRRIKWIGRQIFGARFIRNNREQVPVRIFTGALGSGLPKRDLYVSPGHSMLLGGVLVLARDLVNEVTVTQEAPPDEVHYYQLEFETHDCLLAEGAWSESFCDYGSLRNHFHNAAEFWALYPEHVTPKEHLMCAPRPEAGPALGAALAPVAAHAAALVTPGPLRGLVDEVSPAGLVRGWAQDTTNPTLPILLEILTGKRQLGIVLACDPRPDLAAVGIGQGRAGFAFNGPKLSRKTSANLCVRRASDAAELYSAPHGRMKVTLLRKSG